MNNNQACAKYFRCHSAYDRCFQALWKKWRSYGRVAGKITLKNTSESERKAIGSILGKGLDEETIHFSMAEFEAGLQTTRYAPVEMKALLEAYFGKKLQTNQTETEEKQRQKRTFLSEIQNEFLEKAGADSTAVKWLGEVMESKKYGYQIIIREYGKDPQQAKALVERVGNALLKLKTMRVEETDVPLAVFAADVSDNPHYFDRGTVGGALLVHAVSYCENVSLPENTHSWRELLQRVWIIPDNVSSMVHAYGLRLKTEKGWHLAYEAFCARKEPCVITMENMRGVVAVQAVGKNVYVVENEMVFTYLVHHLQTLDCTLLCTSGQPRSVAQLLIPLILESDSQIYYSGDMDPDGIQIAERLWKKFGDGIHIWRMSPEDYEKSCSEEWIRELGIRKLKHICHPCLKGTAEAVAARRLAGYQENILQELLADIQGRDVNCKEII